MTPAPAPAQRPGSQMLAEALEAPARVAALLAADADRYAALAARLRLRPRDAVLTLARGSSDHAAHHFGYLATARLGRLVTSLPMSLVTLYGARLDAAALVSLAFSQSGQSPDLVEPTLRLRAGAALTAAFVNDPASPLAEAAEFVLPLHAGAEASVAATKSCLAQLVAGARLVAAWQGDAAFAAAVAALPEALARAAAADAASGVRALEQAVGGADRLYVLGRGPGLAVAMELALKFKETCGLQAEAFSGAEVQHGPMALVGEGFPVLVLATRGPGLDGLLALAAALAARGARVLLAATPEALPQAPGARLPLPLLPLVPAAHPDLDAIVAAQHFYAWIEGLARARGLDPDAPPHLSKVTLTR